MCINDEVIGLFVHYKSVKRTLMYFLVVRLTTSSFVAYVRAGKLLYKYRCSFDKSSFAKKKKVVYALKKRHVQMEFKIRTSHCPEWNYPRSSGEARKQPYFISLAQMSNYSQILYSKVQF